MAPTPKPPRQRVRRNASRHEWRTLHVGEHVEPPPLPQPAPQGGWTDEAVRTWGEWWASPMAASVWIEADQVALRRAIRIVDRLATGRRGGQAALIALEDRLGLTPDARARLQWLVERRRPSKSPEP